MKEEHKGVLFRYSNKLGINSRPNAWTLFFGKQIYEMGKNPYTGEILPDLNVTMHCDRPNDNENFWMHRFRDLGYHTLMADDWGSNAIAYPYCWGFLRPPAKHYMTPFQRRREEIDAVMLTNTSAELCHETFQYTSGYLEQFMAAYKNESQLGFIWNSNLAHDYQNGLYHADDHFYRM
uniref:Exostosin domain-containing protein n=1 Tax=Steinernema glaseri TaxID=37863 RepID=A0A1I8AG82_9BILA